MKPRDGVWTANGLQADFRLIRKHPVPGPDVYRVETASGESWACGEELDWETKRRERREENQRYRMGAEE